jgi:hypothetical protein
MGVMVYLGRARHMAVRIGGVCAIVGSLAVFGFRLAHGDPPAAHPEGYLRYISAHPIYATVHLGTIVGVLVWIAGFVALTTTLNNPLAGFLGRLGIASSLLGGAVFITDFTIDGIAGQDLARAWVNAGSTEQTNLLLAAQIATTMLRGTSLVSIIILWGIPPMLFGRAVRLEGYSSWLWWTGLLVGVATIIGATALLIEPELFPGVIVYGLLASIAVQLWSLSLGIVLLRRATYLTR